jgi:hypothetical protein
MNLTIEEKRARKRAYDQRNREKFSARVRAYNQSNREKIKARRRAYHQRNREKVTAKQRAYHHRNREKLLAQKRWKWKLSTQRLQETEAGRRKPSVCEVCGRKGRIVFDHCHQKNNFRGWLCNDCNIVLGLVGDNPNRLRMLIAYLERTKDYISLQLTLPI